MKLKNQLLQYRTEATARTIIDLTNNMNVDILISDIFVWTNNPIAQTLIKLYESQIILSCINPEKFKRNLLGFYKNTTKYIYENNLQNDFLSFFYFVFSTMMLKNELKNTKSLDCYLDILLQQCTFFTSPPNIINGFDNINNDWIISSEPYPNIDKAMLEVDEKLRSLPFLAVKKAFSQYGYKVNSTADILSIQLNDQLLTTMMLIMSCFINEQTPNIIPKNYFLVAHGIGVPSRKNPTNAYKNLLKEKLYYLPSRGVKGTYKNALEIKKIYFQEIYIYNRIMLLYKITSVDRKELCGFYDTKLELFYSPWEGTDNGRYCHNNVENFVLESYCYLTTDIENKETELNLKKRFLVNTEPMSDIEKAMILLTFEYEDIYAKANEVINYKPFDKDKYKQIMRQINPQIRKLPIGMKASEEAQQLAKEYNYIIQDGETFVRPFKKRVYTKYEI